MFLSDRSELSISVPKDMDNFFQVPKELPLNFFHILQPAGVSQSPRGPPFILLSLRYSADFGRSRLVNTNTNSVRTTTCGVSQITYRWRVRFRNLYFRPRCIFRFPDYYGTYWPQCPCDLWMTLN